MDKNRNTNYCMQMDVYSWIKEFYCLLFTSAYRSLCILFTVVLAMLIVFWVPLFSCDYLVALRKNYLLNISWLSCRHCEGGIRSRPPEPARRPLGRTAGAPPSCASVANSFQIQPDRPKIGRLEKSIGHWPFNTFVNLCPTVTKTLFPASNTSICCSTLVITS